MIAIAGRPLTSWMARSTVPERGRSKRMVVDGLKGLGKFGSSRVAAGADHQHAVGGGFDEAVRLVRGGAGVGEHEKQEQGDELGDHGVSHGKASSILNALPRIMSTARISDIRD
jgi:hypothetical protein